MCLSLQKIYSILTDVRPCNKFSQCPQMCLTLQQIFKMLIDVSNLTTLLHNTQGNNFPHRWSTKEFEQETALIQHRRGTAQRAASVRSYCFVFYLSVIYLTTLGIHQIIRVWRRISHSTCLLGLLSHPEIEAVRFSETSIIFYHTTRRCILKDSTLYFYFVIVLPRYLRFEINEAFRVLQGIQKCSYMGYIFWWGGGSLDYVCISKLYQSNDLLCCWQLFLHLITECPNAGVSWQNSSLVFVLCFWFTRWPHPAYSQPHCNMQHWENTGLKKLF
jgi:hypothetical protein